MVCKYQRLLILLSLQQSSSPEAVDWMASVLFKVHSALCKMCAKAASLFQESYKHASCLENSVVTVRTENQLLAARLQRNYIHGPPLLPDLSSLNMQHLSVIKVTHKNDWHLLYLGKYQRKKEESLGKPSCNSFALEALLSSPFKQNFIQPK